MRAGRIPCDSHSGRRVILILDVSFIPLSNRSQVEIGRCPPSGPSYFFSLIFFAGIYGKHRWPMRSPVRTELWTRFACDRHWISLCTDVFFESIFDILVFLGLVTGNARGENLRIDAQTQKYSGVGAKKKHIQCDTLLFAALCAMDICNWSLYSGFLSR